MLSSDLSTAFGHAGQKCSAASLVITVGSVARSERFRRQPGWKDKPSPIAFRRWPEHDHVPAHDNAGRAENAKRKARITLPKISILKP